MKKNILLILGTLGVSGLIWLGFQIPPYLAAIKSLEFISIQPNRSLIWIGPMPNAPLVTSTTTPPASKPKK